MAVAVAGWTAGSLLTPAICRNAAPEESDEAESIAGKDRAWVPSTAMIKLDNDAIRRPGDIPRAFFVLWIR